MFWFKHKTEFRHTDSMRMVESMGGNEAVGIWYKLMEVGAAHINDANGFTNRVPLDAPLTPDYLAADVMGTLYNEDGEQRTAQAEDLEPFLVIFEQAGLITRENKTVPGTRIEKGKRVDCTFVRQTIVFDVLEGNRDEYTAKSMRKEEMREARKKKRVTEMSR